MTGDGLGGLGGGQGECCEWVVIICVGKVQCTMLFFVPFSRVKTTLLIQCCEYSHENSYESIKIICIANQIVEGDFFSSLSAFYLPYTLT